MLTDYNIRDVKGFILLIEYPGCRKSVGDFEPRTSGEFLKYPKIWKPVFTEQYIRNRKLEELGIVNHRD